MRRKQKYMLNGGLIVGGITVTIDILSQWIEKRNNSEQLTWRNVNGKRVFRNGLIGFGVGAGLGYLYYNYKISEEEKMPFNSDEYLRQVIMGENIKNDPVYFQKCLKYREHLKSWLGKKFGDYLVTGLPLDGGSFVKRTAIASNHDLDIVLPFKKFSYHSLESMFYDVYDSTVEEYGRIACVRKQSKAIQLVFTSGQDEFYFDIVPGREINNFNRERDLNLYVRPDWIWQRGSSFKTNIFSQRNITVNQHEARQIIKLLKMYRDRNGLELPSIIIEQCVIRAMSESNFGIQSSITENLLNCMGYIPRKLNQQSLKDISNTNNNLNDKLHDSDKSIVINQMVADIKNIEDNPRYIKEVFEL